MAAALLLAAGCGLRAAPPPKTPPKRVAPAPAPKPVTAVTVQNLGPLLPAALAGTAAATFDGRIYILGGSGPAGFSDRVYAFTPPSGSAAGGSGTGGSAAGGSAASGSGAGGSGTSGSGTGGSGAGGSGTGAVAAVGRLPVALHDAAAVATAGGVLLCGGGRNVGHPAVYRVTSAGVATLVGAMPRALSDLAGANAGGRAYCLGGWTGHLYSDQVYDVSALATGGVAGHGAATLVAHLPHAVRYAAADGLKGGILVSGGLTYTGKPTTDVQWLPLGGSGSGQAAPAVVGHLPAPLDYAMGAVLDGTALVVGGCNAAGSPLAQILSVTEKGVATKVGDLPQGLCYGSAATLGGAVYVFGGEVTGRRASRDVWRISQPAS